MFAVFVSMACLGAKQAIGFNCHDGHEVRMRIRVKLHKLQTGGLNFNLNFQVNIKKD